MEKTLVIILNHNVFDLADNLYNMLSPYTENIYDLIILDNGSDEDRIPANTTIHLENNSFFGGGLNYAFNLILETEKYDSLLFLNNDLILNGYNFVKKLRNDLFNNDLMILSPSIITGCSWPHMMVDAIANDQKEHKNSDIRLVKWVDFQAPLFNRKFIEHVKQYDDDLKYGWGQDILSGILCEENNWNIGISDKVNITHLKEMTFKTGSCKIDGEKMSKSTYRNNASNGMTNYFIKIDKKQKLDEYRNWSKKVYGKDEFLMD